MISCLAFIPRGAAAEVPTESEIPAEVLEQLVAKQAQLSLNDDDDDDEDEGQSASAKVSGMRDDDDNDVDWASGDEKEDSDAEQYQFTELPDDEEGFLKALNMDGYDDEDEGPHLALTGTRMAFHISNEEDPYITLPDDALEDEDADDLVLNHETDKLYVVGNTEAEHSSLEVHVYDSREQTTYVHHDVMIPSFPLCVEWMGYGLAVDAAALEELPDPEQLNNLPLKPAKGNFCAVGTFLPGIEIWNLDVINAIEPVCTLGGHAGPVAPTSKSRKKKSKKRNLADQMQGELKPGSHTDAVLSLSWHPKVAPRLASGSADKTVKLWDVSQQSCVQTYTHHTSKVQVVQWNPAEFNVLLTGSFDGAIGMLDARQAQAKPPSWKVPHDIECMRWSPHHAFEFAVSTESGAVYWFDARKPGANPLLTLEAHQAACTGLAFSGVPGVFATCSVDSTVKVWRQNLETRAPTLIRSAPDMQIGKGFCISFDMDDPYLLVAGGSKGKVALWDTRDVLNPVEHRKLMKQRAEFQGVDPDQPEEKPQAPKKMSLVEKAVVRANIKSKNKKKKKAAKNA